MSNFGDRPDEWDDEILDAWGKAVANGWGTAGAPQKVQQVLDEPNCGQCQASYPYKSCPMPAKCHMDKVTDLKIKEYKCMECKKRCEGTAAALDILVTNCQFARTSRRKPCGLEQMLDFVKKTEQWAKERSKQTPVLLVPKQSVYSHTDVPDNDGMVEIEYPDPIRIIVSKNGQVDVIE